MSKKGFTLIELLAVIVILAIIALIAVPIILNIINDSKKQSNQRSAELYLKAAELAIARKNLTEELGNTVCTVQSSGNLICTGVEGEIKVDVDGTRPETGSKITFTNGKIASISSYKVGDTSYKLENGSLKVDDGTEDDELTCVDDAPSGAVQLGNTGEYFYKIAEEGGYSYYLAKYNLMVGNVITDIDMNTGGPAYGEAVSDVKQNVCAKGGILDFAKQMPDFTNGSWYGIITFSDTNYWYDSENSEMKLAYKNNAKYPNPSFASKGDGCNYVYDSNSNLYTYIEQYKTYLISKDSSLNIIDARPITDEELVELGVSLGTAPAYMSNTSYWQASFTQNKSVAIAKNVGGFEANPDFDFLFGIRPLIVIQES